MCPSDIEFALSPPELAGSSFMHCVNQTMNIMFAAILCSMARYHCRLVLGLLKLIVIEKTYFEI
jgi:hypothetical protein